jgi:hypothetical protein
VAVQGRAVQGVRGGVGRWQGTQHQESRGHHGFHPTCLRCGGRQALHLVRLLVCRIWSPSFFFAFCFGLSIPCCLFIHVVLCCLLLVYTCCYAFVPLQARANGEGRRFWRDGHGHVSPERCPCCFTHRGLLLGTNISLNQSSIMLFLCLSSENRTAQLTFPVMMTRQFYILMIRSYPVLEDLKLWPARIDHTGTTKRPLKRSSGSEQQVDGCVFSARVLLDLLLL